MTNTTTASEDADLIFYDIASGPPVRPFAPNPWKVRYALNFKRARFATQWVDLADVATVRKGLCATPSRYHASGEPFLTLPIVQERRSDGTGAVVGDSFEIAVFLDARYTGAAPPLFRPGVPVGLYAAFNAHADAVFPTAAALASAFPFNPATAARCQAEFMRRAGVTGSWDDNMVVRGEARRAILAAFEKSLAAFAALYRFVDDAGGADDDNNASAAASSPFLAGTPDPDYADLIVGGWLMFFVEAVPEWTEIREWHGGRWGRLHDALAPYRGTW